MKNKFYNVQFLLGAQKYRDLQHQFNLPEIAFIGRSNVGKSTLINSICYNQSIARVSKMPGCTQQINFFNVENKFVLADMPGYGYAKISAKKIASIENLISSYFSTREALKIALLLVDARRGVKDSDIAMINLFIECGIKFHVIFTKTDKISVAELEFLHKKFRELSELYNCSDLFSDAVYLSAKKDSEKAYKEVKRIILENL